MASPFLVVSNGIECGEAPSAISDYVLGRGGCLLLKNVKNHYGILGKVVHDAPVHGAIHDTQFMAASSDIGHRSRYRKTERFSPLQPPQQKAGFDAGVAAKRRRLNLPAQPRQRLVAWAHSFEGMSYRTYYQAMATGAMMSCRG
jgi:hypothetical protein